MRCLIVNADDYGLCASANEAVERLFDAGAITTATLMTPAPMAEDGIRRAKANPRMCLGLHLTTTCEYDAVRWGPVDHSCRSLTLEDGSFYKTARDNLAHALPEEMEKEIRAQYSFMAGRGVPPEHVDSHMATVYGLHGFSCMEQALRLCAEHGLNFRFPRNPETFSGDVPPRLRAAAEEGVRLADRMGVGLPDGLFTYDFDLTREDGYEMFRGAYMEMVRRCPEGVSELFMHPCVESRELKNINGQWKKRVWEFQVLLDPVFRECIRREGIRLTTYHEAPFSIGGVPA